MTHSMMKYVFCLPLLLLACANPSSNGGSSADFINCNLGVVPQINIQESEIPTTFGWPIEQKSLATLMNLSDSQGLCYVQHQSDVKVYKAPEQQNTNPTFARLRAQPKGLLPNWQNSWSTSGGNLKGLTTTEFSRKQQSYSLVKIYIVLDETAKQWHLWHEYVHYLVKKSLFNYNKFKLSPSMQDLGRMQRQVMHSQGSESNARLIQEWVEAAQSYAHFSLIEEIFVEVTLVDLISKNPTMFHYSSQDLQNASGFIGMYFGQVMSFYGPYLFELKNMLQNTQMDAKTQTEVERSIQIIEDEISAVQTWQQQAQQQIQDLLSQIP